MSTQIRRCKFLGRNPQDGTPQGGLPLKHQEVNVAVDNAVAVLDVVQTFINDKEFPLEVTLEFPVEKEHALSGLTIQIGEDIIEGKVLQKEKAKEKYEDAIASGHTAVTAEEKADDPDTVRLKIGNLLSGQEAIVRFRLLHVLRIEVGAYAIRIPVSFFPSADTTDYNFSMHVDLRADAAITYVSAPEGTVVARHEAEESKTSVGHVTVEKALESGSSLSKDIVIYYRTANMDMPALLAQKSSVHPDEVAVMLSFVPSFQEALPSTTPLETAYDERPEPQDLPETMKEEGSFFIFIVDRSGSMSGSKMEVTKEAVILFLKSLPSNARFDIVSFGSTFKHMSPDQKGFEYNDKNVEFAVNELKTFSADLGGTEIYEPLESSVNHLVAIGSSVKKIFLLTDGEVSSPEKVAALAKKAADSANCRIHTFGVGSDCSVKLVTDVARVGKGTCSLVIDNKALRPIVVQALARAQEPQYSNCRVTFSPSLDLATNSLSREDLSKGFEIFRHDACFSFGILKMADFEKLQVNLISDPHPVTKKQLTGTWTAHDFRILGPVGLPSVEGSTNTGGNELFKIIARQRVNQLVAEQNAMNSWDGRRAQFDKEIEALSLKYQIMSKQTTFLGVSKNSEKPTQELQQIELTPIVEQKESYKRKIQSSQNAIMNSPTLCASQPAEQMSLGRIQASIHNRAGAAAPKSSAPGVFSKITSAIGSVFKQSKKESAQIPDERLECCAMRSSSPLNSVDVKCCEEKEESQEEIQIFGGGMRLGAMNYAEEDECEKNRSVPQIKEKKCAFSKDQSQSKMKKKVARKMSSSDSDHSSGSDDEEEEKRQVVQESSKKSAPAREQVAKLPPPVHPIKPKTLDDLLLGQASSTGAWSDKALILSFFADAVATESDAKTQEILAMASTEADQVWLTVLALYVLATKFGAREDEWQLIANKAKTFLKSKGIAKPDSVLKTIKFPLN